MYALDPQSEIRTASRAPRSPKRIAAFAAVLAVLFASNHAAARLTDTVPVFHCTFVDDWDVDYDKWPDRWTREEGPDHPHYVNIAIEDDESAANKRCLTIRPDGAGAALSSPRIRVMSRFSYELAAQLRNEGLKFSTVVITLDFCDASGQVLQSARTDPVSNTNGWQTIRIRAVEPRNPAIDHAVLGLRVVRGAKGDLKGRVSLADVWLERLPRIDVSTNSSCNVFTSLNDIVVDCALSGIRERDPDVHFQLLDGANRELQNEHFRLNGRLIVDTSSGHAQQATHSDEPNGYEGSIRWQPKIPDYGYYRVAVRMISSNPTHGANHSERQPDSRTVDLVVVPPLEMPRQGEFGWTLPDGDQPLSFQDLARLLPEVGINWTKVPVWFDANDPRRGDELIRFVELLGASNIDVVGIIDRPPSKPAGGRIPASIPIADVLSDDSTQWSTSLEPVMSRLALRVRWWQLGRDDDTSLIGLPTVNKRINELRTVLFRFGQDVRMGLCADWESAGAYAGDVSWDFMQLAVKVEPSKTKFEELLSRPRQNSAQRWIIVDPPSSSTFQPSPSDSDLAICGPAPAPMLGGLLHAPAWIKSIGEAPEKLEAARAARARTFVHRLISAKLHAADAIIVARPFDDDNGLLRADGMPAELLLPWRTTAAMLGGGQYLGSMQLPAGSENRIFLRPDGQVVMVAWNREPVREVLYLGNNVRQFDILGRSTPAGQQGREQAIDVGPSPTFVLGLHEAITRWRMSVQFTTTKVPSVFSKPHHNALAFKNYFPQGVGGTVKLVVLQPGEGGESRTRPNGSAGFQIDRWTIEPPRSAFQLAAGGESKFDFDVKLKNALYGKQPVRIDFTIEADERLEFSVYQTLEVGTDDIALDVKSRLEKDGTLVVEQFMTNRTDRLADFKCHLRSKGHQPLRMQVYRLGKVTDRKVYRIADGRDLIGKEVLLEIEEVNGPRMLHYRFLATESPTPDERLDVESPDESQPAEEDTRRASENAPPLASARS